MRYIKHLAAIPALAADDDLARLQAVADRYVFRSSEYYLGLIDWDDPADPIRSSVLLTNQCPLIHGINDDAAVLGELFRRLSWIGCPPYYLFQGRPTAGNAPYRVPITRGWAIFQEAKHMGSGLARRARYVMSHASGKVEIQAVDENYIYLRHHRTKAPALRARFMIYHRDDEACWLDDLVRWRPARPCASRTTRPARPMRGRNRFRSRPQAWPPAWPQGMAAGRGF